MSNSKGYIAVDFDGTLAEYHGWVKWNVFGKPIPAMVERVKGWLAEGKDVRIMTARVGVNPKDTETCFASGEKFTTYQMKQAIMDWTEEHVGERLRVTCVKDTGMLELWDDRAVQVVPNTGRTLAEETLAKQTAEQGKVAAMTTQVNRVQHVKTEGFYTVVGDGHMQCSEPLRDMAAVVIYKSDKDGSFWVRPTYEFNNRFRQVE